MMRGRMKRSIWIAGAALGLVFAACADEAGDKPDKSDVKGGPDGKSDAWGSSDDPALFNGSLEYRLTELPRQGAAQNTPWSGSYWPVEQDSINFKWAGASSDSASTKYGRAFNVTGVEDAVSKYHGIDAYSSRKSCTKDADCDANKGEGCGIRPGKTSGRCIPTWWGICHAWTPASILLPEPKHDVVYNGVTFKVQDVKALVTLVHDQTESRFVSLRCDQLDADSEIAFDKYGRPTGSSAGCKDTNPGTFHVLVTNYLGKQSESFAEDRTWDAEVWNQPLAGYRITAQDEVTGLQANTLIGVPPEGGTSTSKNGTVNGGQWIQLGNYAITGGANVTVTMTGTGDPDLYVRFGSQPTDSSYDCRPYVDGAGESCSLTAPSGATTVYVAVNAYGTASATYDVKIIAGGTIPSKYVFNDKAAHLYKTHMQTDYIGESDPSVGYIGTGIGRYTRHDDYDYILEVDTAGKIIGGEWFGTSTKDHPDFVWLPIRHSASSVAGGKITYANVKTIYDLSVADASPPSTGGDKTVTDSATVASAAWKQYGPYNVAAGATFTATMTGDGDADLYVRKTAAPSSASYDCRPYTSSSNESCSIIGPATVYVGVNGYAPSSSYALTITYKEGTGSSNPPPPPSTIQHIDTTGSVAQGEMKMFTLDVIAGHKIYVRTFSQVDVDLYIQMGAAPTTGAYLARGYTTSGNETVSYTPTSNGKLYIGVHGYAAGSFSLKTADQ